MRLLESFASVRPPISTRGGIWIAGALYLLLVCSAVTVAGTAAATAILVIVLLVLRPPLTYDRWEATDYLLPFFALTTLILIAAVLNPDRGTALREADEYRLVVFPLMLLFALPYVRTRRILQVLCVTAGVMALYGVYQYATGTDPLYWYRTDYARARGGFINPLTFAGYMLPLGLIFAPLALAERSRWRWGWALGALAAGASIILSLSRSGLLGLVAGAWVLLYRRKRRLALRALIAAVVLSVALMASAGVLRSWLVGSDPQANVSLLQRFVVIDPLGDASIRDRLYIWEAGLRGWADRPLLGFGSGMHSYHLEPYQRAVAEDHGRPGYDYSTGYNTSLHNMLVRMLFDLGIMGLAVYLWMWGTVFATIRTGLRGPARGDPWRRALLWGLAAGFVGLFVAGLFEDNFFDAEVQTLTLFLMMLVFGETRHQIAKTPAPSP